ncbi:hypothetical protein [Kineococcus arenarius]|uniref:hypothetical protein n=1 Tax=unclassified Kineococcus TaxID=2621656 RepID=UPI003D7CCBAF
MNHYRELAYHLRRRRLSEDDVARVLAEVRDLSRGSAEVAREEFGPAKTYAENFPEGSTRWTWTRFASWGVHLAGVVFLVGNQELRRRGVEVLLPWWGVLAVWLATVVAGDRLRFLLDHRLPRGCRVSAVPSPGPEPHPSSPALRERAGGEPAGPAKPSAYYRDLAFHLRLRQLPEAEVVRVLEEVRELALTSGCAPEVEFGPAQEYAEQFDQRERRYAWGSRVFTVCGLLALAIGLTDVVAELRGEDFLPPGSLLLIFAGLLVGGALVAVVHGHRLPRGFRERS